MATVTWYKLQSKNGAEGMGRIPLSELGDTSEGRALQKRLETGDIIIVAGFELESDADIGWREDEQYPHWACCAWWDRSPYPNCPVSGQPHKQYFSWCWECRDFTKP